MGADHGSANVRREFVPGLTIGTGKKRMRKSIDLEIMSVLDKIKKLYEY